MTEIFKYHGLGNDFVVVERSDDALDASRVRRICDRRRGAGADGVLVVSPASSADAAAKMTLYNRDGSRPEMCGNGIRCVVRHLVETGDVNADGAIVVETDAGPRRCRVVSDRPSAWSVSVEMGEARVGDERCRRTVDGTEREFVPVDVGNPHAVSFEPAPADVVDAFGEWFNREDVERFPRGVNVEFVGQRSETEFDVAVWERGVGRTRACGTGACAVAAAAWETGRAPTGEAVHVDLPGGTLEIRRSGDVIWMTGPATAVFRGTLAADVDANGGDRN